MRIASNISPRPPASDALGRDAAADVKRKIHSVERKIASDVFLHFVQKEPEGHALGLVDGDAVLFHSQVVLKSLPGCRLRSNMIEICSLGFSTTPKSLSQTPNKKVAGTCC